MKALENHNWPVSIKDHLWGPWMQAARTDAKGGATQYRMCVHPECGEHEKRVAPKA